MNGRIYDPAVGRFLSADPFVQFEDNMQSMNRYAYVLNNPLSATDPSGYFSLSDIVKIAVTVFVAVYAPGALGFQSGMIGYAVAGGAAAGFTGGLISGGGIQGAIRGGITGAFSGALFGSLHFVPEEYVLSKIALHGLAGGLTSEVQGGKFKAGFLAGSFTKAFGGGLTGDKFTQGLKAAVLGGTASVIGGGKFGNGAITGAFSRLFNDLNKPEPNSAKLGAAFKTKMFDLYGDTDGNFKFSKDLKAVTLTINEAGDVLASGQFGIFKGQYSFGEGLESFGLKVPGTEIKFSEFSRDGVRWSVSVPKTIFGVPYKGTYGGVINTNLPYRARHNGILAPSFDRLHNLNSRCLGGDCGL